ncbi:MAG: hypothetical protein ACREX3_20390 [Gammaproteobacteria bacterium]
MLRRLLVVLLLFSWVVLSGFDLLEDLTLDSESRAYAQGATDKFPSPNFKHRGSLANNIVESAARAQVFCPSLLRLSAYQSPLHLVLSSRRVLKLHKLHRVFLI